MTEQIVGLLQAPEPPSSLKEMAERAALGLALDGEIPSLHLTDRGNVPSEYYAVVSRTLISI